MRSRNRSVNPKAPASIERLLMGRNAAREVLQHASDRVVAVWGTRDALEELRPQLQGASLSAEQATGEDLALWVHSDSHQGVVVQLKECSMDSIDSLVARCESKSHATVLLLDSIYDPQNFGTLLRAAECFGVDGVVWSKNRGSGVTPVVRKASVGASELVPMIGVQNLADTVQKLQQAAFWVVALDGGEESVEIGQFTFPEKSVLIAGSEGRGVQPLLLKRSDFRVRIPLRGKIDSLNVSQATTVALYALQQQRRPND